ncbi:hypothetical protein Mapa_008860 [Marchantia paleacea]|nr:hypothetical protein Mapa_008860 [Marchantia paleacea]
MRMKQALAQLSSGRESERGRELASTDTSPRLEALKDSTFGSRWGISPFSSSRGLGFSLESRRDISYTSQRSTRTNDLESGTDERTSGAGWLGAGLDWALAYEPLGRT